MTADQPFRRRAALVATALVLTVLAAPTSTAAERNPVPVPVVSGPVTGGLKGHPFNALPFDPATVGYVEEEFLLSGTATSYDLSPVALRSLGESAPVVAPYTTRMVVRRPADPKRFNGTVVVEWLNVTSGYDVEASFAELRRELLRGGYAYAGVTAQAVGAAGLRLFDALRYAPVVHPGDPFSYDVFAQAVQALRAPGGPLGTAPETVIATGASQSGAALNNYLNLVAPVVEPVIDGFLVMTSAGPLADPEVPVVRVLTEGEAGAGHADSTNFREWEIASATHADKAGGDWFARTHDRDFFPGWPLTPRDQPGIDGTCLIGRMPKYLAMHAALDALDRWVRGGPGAPTAPRIVMDGDAVARDGNDNAIGGIRLPAADAPVAAYYGDKDECGPTMGRTVPFTTERLAELYPTHRHYVDQVRASARRAVSDGFLLPHDARAVIEEARSSTVGG